MYYIIIIFCVYSLGIISYEYNFYIQSIILFLLYIIFEFVKSKKLIYNIVLFIFFIFAIINTNYNSKSVLGQHINESQSLILNIKSQKKVNPSSDYNSFEAIITHINNKKLKNNENTIVYIKKTQNIPMNSIVKLTGLISDVEISKNKYMFNYKNYLRSQKIYAVIFSEDKIQIIKSNRSIFNKIQINFKKYVENIFMRNFNNDNAQILLSVVLSDVNYLDDSFYENVKSIGLAHIFAVSGTHIALIYGFLLKMFRLVRVHPKISWLLTWMVILIYSFLIGFPISVLRAFVMFTLVFGSNIFYRKYSSLNSIGLGALILAMYNPFWIFDAGYLFSFSAALSLILYARIVDKNINENMSENIKKAIRLSGNIKRINIVNDNIKENYKLKFKNNTRGINFIKIKNYILKKVYPILFLQIFTLPVVIYYFNYVPIMGILYNLLLVPIFTICIISAFIIIILYSILKGGLLFFIKLFDYMLYSLRFVINSTENLYLNGLNIRTLSICEIIFFYIVMFFVLYLYSIKFKYKKYNKCIFSIIIFFYILTYIIVPISYKNVYFNVVDAGQGLFTVFSYKNYNFIFDLGSTSNKKFGEYTVVPYLNKKGISKIDAIFVSHWDADHYSGIFELLDSKIKVKNIFSSFDCENADHENMNLNINILKKDNYIKIDNNVSLEVLWPYSDYIAKNKNNTSLVISIDAYGKKILLTGDIESGVENDIVNILDKHDILIIPHHGSKTSSTENFVKNINPEIAIASYGKNSYGIPSSEVINRYKFIGSKVLSTFEHGEINFVINDDIYFDTYTKYCSDNYKNRYLEFIFAKILLFFLIIYYLLILKNNYESL